MATNAVSNSVGSGPAPRVSGLDSIRLAAALVVALSHGMLIPNAIYDNQGSKAAFWSGQIAHMLASGTGAVALFFVVSGLCIHLGRRAAERNPLLFLVRRMVRIGLPMASILVITGLAGPTATELERGVLWSIYCEIGYYFAYPLLLVARRRWSMERILLGFIVMSAGLLIVLPGQELIWQYGLWTPLICYPLWIVGALVAESVPSIAPRRSEHLWRWRAGIVLAAGACAVIRHLPGAGDLSALTYVVVGILAVPFLREEIAHAMAVPPSAVAERLGQATYSIYLVHRFPLYWVENNLVGEPGWIVGATQVALVAACSAVFFFVCERPALNLARAISFSPHWKPYRSAL